MTMSLRAFTCLSNAFSRKLENRAAPVALDFDSYNFARPPKSLRTVCPDPGDGSTRDRSHLVVTGNRILSDLGETQSLSAWSRHHFRKAACPVAEPRLMWLNRLSILASVTRG